MKVKITNNSAGCECNIKFYKGEEWFGIYVAIHGFIETNTVKVKHCISSAKFVESEIGIELPLEIIPSYQTKNFQVYYLLQCCAINKDTKNYFEIPLLIENNNLKDYSKIKNEFFNLRLVDVNKSNTLKRGEDETQINEYDNTELPDKVEIPCSVEELKSKIPSDIKSTNNLTNCENTQAIEMSLDSIDNMKDADVIPSSHDTSHISQSKSNYSISNDVETENKSIEHSIASHEELENENSISPNSKKSVSRFKKIDIEDFSKFFTSEEIKKYPKDFIKEIAVDLRKRLDQEARAGKVKLINIEKEKDVYRTEEEERRILNGKIEDIKMRESECNLKINKKIESDKCEHLINKPEHEEEHVTEISGSSASDQHFNTSKDSLPSEQSGDSSPVCEEYVKSSNLKNEVILKNVEGIREATTFGIYENSIEIAKLKVDRCFISPGDIRIQYFINVKNTKMEIWRKDIENETKMEIDENYKTCITNGEEQGKIINTKVVDMERVFEISINSDGITEKTVKCSFPGLSMKNCIFEVQFFVYLILDEYELKLPLKVTSYDFYSEE